VHCFLADDRGSVTAEFAVVLPAAILVLGLCLAALSGATTHIANAAVARDAARSLSRGKTDSEVTYSVAVARPRASMVIERSALAGCVRLSESIPLTNLLEVLPPLEVSSCAVHE
jgi:Flp pilus assembly protein TadG